MECEAIFFSDTHCLKLRKLFPENHLALTMAEFRKPLDYAVKQGIKYVIHGGDVFDVPVVDHRYSKALIKLLLEYPNLKIIFILGNHDFEDNENNSMHFISLCCEFGILSHVKVYQEKSLIKLDGVTFNLLPFPHTRLSKKPVVNVGHFEPKNACRDNGMRIKKGVDTESKKAINLIGHIHKQQEIGDNTLLSGGLFPTNFGEQDVKGWYHLVLRYNKKKDILKKKATFVKNNCAFDLINLPIEVQDDFSKIEKDPLKLYKLQLADGISVPPKLTAKRPNIISVVGFKGGEELALFSKELPEEMYTGSDALDNITSDPVWGLLDFLKGEGLDKEQRKRALQLVKQQLESTSG